MLFCEPSATGPVGANLRLLNAVTGNITGLKPSQKHALERVYRRRLRARGGGVGRAGGATCARSRARSSARSGILVDRAGEIEHVFVGDASRINLPEIGRLRAGRGPLPRPAPGAHPPAQRAADARRPGRPRAAAAGSGRGDRGAARRAARPICTSRTCCRRVEGRAARGALLPTEPFYRSTLDAAALIEALEEEFERVAPAAVATDKRDRALLVVVDVRGRRGPGAPRRRRRADSGGAGRRAARAVPHRRRRA